MHCFFDCRYVRTATPTDRYHTAYAEKERCGSNSSDRYGNVEKYGGEAYASSLGRRSPGYKSRDRSRSAERKCNGEPTFQHVYDEG